MTNFVNILWFQLGWWTLVLSASSGQQGLGFLVCLLLLAVFFGKLSQDRRFDLMTLITCGSVGISGDYLLLELAVLNSPDSNSIFPLWLLGLWMIFPLTLNYSFKSLMERPILHPIIAILAACSYSAGEVFKILYFSEPKWLNILWASAMWLIYFSVFGKAMSHLRRQKK